MVGIRRIPLYLRMEAVLKDIRGEMTLAEAMNEAERQGSSFQPQVRILQPGDAEPIEWRDQRQRHVQLQQEFDVLIAKRAKEEQRFQERMHYLNSLTLEEIGVDDNEVLPMPGRFTWKDGRRCE